MSRWIFVPELLRGTVPLLAETAHHLEGVLRLKRGENVVATNGKGQVALARLGGQGRQCWLEITQLEEHPVPLSRTILLGMPAPALVEECLMLGTEAGATRFLLVPMRYSPPGRPRIERLERIAQAALIQCQRAWVPALHSFADLKTALSAIPEQTRLMGQPGAPRLAPKQEPACLAIGPEGGFSPEEQVILVKADFQPVGLGSHILRAPTAIAAGLSLLWPG